MRRSRKPLCVLLAYREFESLPLRCRAESPAGAGDSVVLGIIDGASRPRTATRRFAQAAGFGRSKGRGVDRAPIARRRSVLRDWGVLDDAAKEFGGLDFEARASFTMLESRRRGRSSAPSPTFHDASTSRGSRVAASALEKRDGPLTRDRGSSRSARRRHIW